MLKSEIMSRYGHEKFEWIQLKKPNYIKDANDNELDYGPYNGWQTWSGDLLKEEDGADYSMIWVPFWGEREEAGAPHDLFEKFYSATLADGSKAEVGGYIKNLVFEKLYDVNEDGEQVEIGEVLTDYDFDEEHYNMYMDTIPNPVPGIVESKLMEADSKTNEMLSAGTTPNTVNLSTLYLNIDGSEVTKPIVYKYDEASQNEILKAFMACRAGLKNYTLNLSGYSSQGAFPAEQIYRIYVELETWKKMTEAYNEVWKKYVSSFKDVGKDQKKVVNDLTYGETELPTEYETMLENKQETIMTEMQELAESLGILE